MKYIIREDKAKLITGKYKSKYIADKIKVSPSYVSYILSGKRLVSYSVANTITQVVDENLSVEELFKTI